MKFPDDLATFQYIITFK